MSNYYPDRFVIVKLTSPEYGFIYKVLASWYGGFAGSDSWKLSSGITKITKTEAGYEFLNYSGSTYFCSKETYGMSFYTSSIYAGFIEQMKEAPEGNSLELINEEAIDSLEV